MTESPAPAPAPGAPGATQTSELAFLKAYLAASDEVCPLCKYALQGLTSNACPECGKVLVLRVERKHPLRGAFIAGIVFISITIGSSALTLVLYSFNLVTMLITGQFPGDWQFELVFDLTLILELVVSLMILRWWIRNDGWIQRQTLFKRLRLAGRMALVPILGFALIIGLFILLT
ncbi:MAG: hypothetical protein O7G85_10880 [Planctomycetota bacterium]|nr:hypothetical protein [Planctomycetota bacterium]